MKDKQEQKAGKKTVDKIFDGIYRVIESIGAICLILQVVIITEAVIGRYIFNSTPPWSEEISRVLMIWMSMLTAAMAVKDDTHVRISILDKLFGKKGIVIRDAIFNILNIAFCFILFSEGWKLVKQSLRTKLPGSGLSSGVLNLSVCIGSLLMTVMLVYTFWRKICHRKQ